MMIVGGVVRKGTGRGRSLGFPTANLPAPVDIDDGTYLAQAIWQGRKFPSLAFIGAAETFGETRRFLEVYLLDFSDDLYGQELRVELVKKIRNNQKFASAEELVEQIKEDERVAREYFGI